MSFVHLHTHSHYSILEGLPKPKNYIKKALELGMPGVALTDSRNVHGCYEFYKEGKDSGINPILGTEILIQAELFDSPNKAVLLAKSYEGYKNILKIITDSNLKNSGKANLEILKSFSNDIIFLSGPASGEIPLMILAGKTDEEIFERIKFYQNIYGNDNFYLELLRHSDIPKQDFITSRLIEIHKKFQTPVVATQNSFYIGKDDAKTQDVIMCLSTGHEQANPDRFNLLNGDYSFLSAVEMEKIFGDIPEALENSLKINEKVKINLPGGRILIPGFDLPELEMNKYQNYLKIVKDSNSLEILNEVGINFSSKNSTNNDSASSAEGQKSEISNSLEKTDPEINSGGQKLENLNSSEDLGLHSKGQIKEKELSKEEWFLRYICIKGLSERFEIGFLEEEIIYLTRKNDVVALEKKLIEATVEELYEASQKFFDEKREELISEKFEKFRDKLERLEYELFVIHEMGFDGYFLIVSDYIMWAKNEGIPVGPGRGSAAGSLLAYTSGITDIDPLEYDLLFERFMNPSRVSMPDIDTDFSDLERDKVLEYCRRKYGKEMVAQICTFGTFAARAAVKDVGRVRGIPFSDMNNYAKLIPEKPGTKLKDALENAVEFKTEYQNNEIFHEIVNDALKIEGNVRQIGVHACAVIIAPEPVTNFTALQTAPKDENTIITQYSAYPLEDIGLLKMDFLGLRNLSIIKSTVDLLKKTKNLDIDILKLKLDDPKVFKIFEEADTTGVFQFESEGMRTWLKGLKPDNFNDIIAMVSLYRPGPMEFIPNYIDRKFGKEVTEYLLPEIRAALEEKGYSEEIILEERRKLFEDLGPFMDITYGIAVYQEQLIRLVQAMAGFSLAEADMLRRGIGKKKIEVIQQLREEFIVKGKDFHNYKEETSALIYDKMIMPAASYSFNKSHAACYAFIAYQTAYLKAYFPAEFMASLMTCDAENTERIALEVAESQNHGIAVLPPSVKESLKDFTYLDDKTIRFGLKAIKGIGSGPVEALIDLRKEKGDEIFESLETFIKALPREVASRKTLEGFIKSGAMDIFGNRLDLLSSLENILSFHKSFDKKEKDSLQLGLFDMTEIDEERKIEIISSKFSKLESLLFEKEVIGLMVSGHPLDGLGTYISKISQNESLVNFDLYDKKTSFEENEDEKNSFLETLKKQKVKTLGFITGFRSINTKSGKMMAFVQCDGFLADFEVVLYDNSYTEIKNDLEIGKTILVEGIVQADFNYMRKSIRSLKSRIISIDKLVENAKYDNYFDNSKRGQKIEITGKNDEKNNSLNNSNISEDNNFGIKNPPNFSQTQNYSPLIRENDGDLENSNFNSFGAENKVNFSSKNLSLDDSASSAEGQFEEFVIKIPDNFTKTELQNLKELLQKKEKGNIKIYILFKGQKIYSKCNVKDLEEIEKLEFSF